MTGHYLFREVQRWRDVWWVMVLVFGLAALPWWIFFMQIVRGVPVGNNPGSDLLVVLIWIIFGIGFPAFFLWLHMVVEIVPEAVIVRYWPFINRRIAINQIMRVEARIYRPLADFGGWGIRGWNGRVAYNGDGETSVEITLRDGRLVLIGTQKAAELASAIYKIWSNPRNL